MEFEHTTPYEKITERNIGIISLQDQEKIKNCSIGLIGLGGVGGLTATLLVKIGFGRIIISDRDFYETSNLNRQILADIDTIGLSKAQVAEKKLQQHNPAISILTINEDLDSAEKIIHVFQDVKVLIIAVDNMSTIIKAVRAVNKLRIPALITGPFGWKCFATMIQPEGPDYEKTTNAPSFAQELTPEVALRVDLFQRLFISHTGGFIPDAATQMLSINEPIVSFAPAVNLTACIAVNELVKWITGRGVIHCFPHYFTLDLLTGESWSVHEIGIKCLESIKKNQNGIKG